jgi:hypothetical protein
MRYLLLTFVFIMIGCGGDESNSTPIADSEPYEVRCKEPLPTFTLGPESNPTNEQEGALCACIWQSLGRLEREVSEKIIQSRDSEVSEAHLRAFIQRFGSAVEKCGGSDL